MTCEVCNSIEVTCNHNVTIKYLKELAATIPSACCTSITVTGNDDYCPTYGELTSGTLIPNFSDGGSGAWSNNRDGIVISGTYSDGQCVAKNDLKLIYTAFESLTVSNSSPTVSECGGSTTSTRRLVFRKYTKECDKTVSSTTQDDTTLSIAWSGTDSSSTGTKTYSRNESFDNTHSSTVKCSISWRGCSHTSSNSVTVSQKVRAFDHYNDYSRSSGESVDVSCSPSSFNCDGGTSYATATYYYKYWTERHYIDTCGYDYQQTNINSGRSSTNINSSLNATSHTFNECEINPSPFEFRASYDGFSDSDYCSMTCTGCVPCPPENYTEYRDTTATCRSYTQSVYVNGTAHTFTGGEIIGGECVGYTESTASTGYYVTVKCNNSGWVDSHVYVSGGPCCTGGTTYDYEPVEVGCESADSFVKQVAYTATTTHTDGSTTTTTGTSGVTIPEVRCNSGSSRTISTYYDSPIVTQMGGCDCPPEPCDCSHIYWNYYDMTFYNSEYDDYYGTGYSPKQIWWGSYSYDSECGVDAGSVSLSVPAHFSASTDNWNYVYVIPTGINRSGAYYTGTLRISYTVKGQPCTTEIELKQQNASSIDCDLNLYSGRDTLPKTGGSVTFKPKTILN